jgi:carboxypeptidase PM20D1
MKRIAFVLFLAILVLLSVLFVNTFRQGSKQLQGLATASPLSLSDSIVQHLAKAIRFRTVSNADPSQMDSAQFEKFIQYIGKTYPLIHQKLKLERINQFGLLYHWQGSNPQLKPALLMGHYDVVPVIQGTERIWKYKPFAAEMAEDILYGRGALDDKVTVMGILEAVEHLLREGHQPERSYYLAFGHDEEVSGLQGGKQIADLLKSRKVQLEYVLDEGGVIKSDGIPGLEKPIALVGVAEKGYTTLELSVTGEGGHSSMPPHQTSIGMLAEAIDRLQKNPFPARLEGAIGHLQDYLAPEMPLGTRLAMSNRWLFKPAIISMISQSPAGNASVRTTIAPTVFNAGVKDNVLPIEASARINFRILPGDSVDGVVAHVKKAINNEQVKVEKMGQFDSNPSPISDTASAGFRLIHRSIKRCFPEVLVAPNLVVGATDSRYYQGLTNNIFRFVPVRMNDEDLKRIHGTNERISKADFKNVVTFFVEMVKGDRGGKVKG